MKIYFLLVLAITFVMPCYGRVISKKDKSIHQVILREHNFVLLKGYINPELASIVTIALVYNSNKLPPGEPIYLVLNTPGGEIESGLRIIATAKSLNREVKTLVIDARSMGFLTVQHLGERLIIPKGYTMTHQPTIYPQGMVRSTFIESLKAQMDLVNQVEEQAARRMRMSLKKYHKITTEDFVAKGENAVRLNIVDRVVHAVCDDVLSKTTVSDVVIESNGEKFLDTFSACPLVKERLNRDPVRTANQ